MTPADTVKLASTTVELMDSLNIRLSNPDDLALKIASRHALANTPEELFADGDTNGWLEHIGRPVLVRNIDWLPSSMEQGIGFYAVVDAVDANTGESLILTTGSSGVCVQLAKAAMMGWLDKPVMLTQSSRPTADGYYPQRLRLA